MPPDPNDVGNVLRPNGRPVESSSGLSEWLARNVLPATVALLLAVLTWNVNEMNAKLDAVQAGQVASQIQDARLEGRIQRAEDRDQAQDAKIERLESLHDRN